MEFGFFFLIVSTLGLEGLDTKGEATGELWRDANGEFCLELTRLYKGLFSTVWILR